jgi:hypothetical protein
MPLINGLQFSSKGILTAFHVVCKGQNPFAIDWSHKEQYTRMDFCVNPNEEEITFMRKIVNIVRGRGKPIQPATKSITYTI